MSWEILYIVVTILLIPTVIIGAIVQMNVYDTFNKFNRVPSKTGLTASELAERLLDRGDVHGVSVNQIDGKLTDCYDSKKKVVNLSTETYNSSSLASLGVCAHEVGHAIQDSRGMFLFKLRRVLVPIVNLISKACLPLLIIGMLFNFLFLIPTVGFYLVWASVIMYGASVLFYLVTLPLELDASKRALRMLKENGFMDDDEIKQTKKVLKSAALTYVQAFIISLLYFLRFLSILLMFFGGRDRK